MPPVWQFLLWACLTWSLLLARLWPSQPLFPGDGLDNSWQFAMDFATAQRMAIGRALVFTYGPYADLASRLYDPATRNLNIAAMALLTASMAVPLAALARPVALLCTVAMLPLAYTNDAFAFVLPLPALLLCAKAIQGPQPKYLMLAMLLMAPAIALLPLIKLSYLPVTLVGAVGAGGLLWMAGRRRLAAVTVLLVCLSVPALWCASGQAIGDLAPYFKNGSAIIAGYAGAMVTLGPIADFEFAIAVAVLILLLLACGGWSLPRRPALLLILCVAGLIFVTLKASFVRQDTGHELEAVGAAGLALLILSAWLPALLAPVAAFAGLFILTGPPNEYGGPGGFRPAITGLLAELHGARVLRFDPVQNANAYASSVADISALPWHPSGTSDIYSQGQSNLLASGLPWAPRPVIQSYSAYTPSLLRMNAQHLKGAAAPDNIFFRPEPIDGHFPALEDGASWPALLSTYAPVAYDFEKDLVWLRRDRSANEAAPGPVALAGPARLGQVVALPDAPALWATINVTPSLAGKLAGVLAKTPLLSLTLKLSDGSTRIYSFVPGMGPTGFLISPLVTTTWDFIHLRQNTSGNDRGPPRVKSFSLDAGERSYRLWQPEYQFTVAPIMFQPVKSAAMRGLPAPVARAMPPVVTRPTCYLDEANGSTVTDAPVTAGSTLQVDGWGAFDVEAGVAADSAELGFVDSAGHAWSVPALLRRRYGVGAHFNHPFLLNLHVIAGADPSSLPAGRYKIELFLGLAGQVVACPTRLSLIVPAK